MSRPPGIAVASVAAAALLAATGCRGGTKTGGAGQKHVSVLTLVIAFAGVPSDMQIYADDVQRLSHGSLRLSIENNYMAGDPQGEKHLIAAVRKGKAQIAWVGSRAWETVGVNSFRALVAPFLIDSYPLEQKVLAGGMTARMLSGIHGHGLVGLAVLPGALKRVAGRRPLLRPRDFRGIAFGTFWMPTLRATARALGARPFPNFGQDVSQLPRDAGGIETDVPSLYASEYFRRLPYVSMNVILWPRPYVVFANARVYDSLAPAQRQALRRAGQDTLRNAMKATESDDAMENVPADIFLCSAKRAGHSIRLLSASRSDLLALRRAVQPVYAMLDRDPQTRALIGRIETLKRKLGAPAGAGASCPRTPIAAARKPSPIDGVYHSHVSLKDAAAHDHIPASEEDPGNYGDTVCVYDRGRYACTQRSDRGCGWAYGRFTVEGHRAAQIWVDTGAFNEGARAHPGENFSPRWSLYRNVLTLDYGPGFVQAYTRLSTRPSRSALFESKHCRLPKEALR